MGASVSSLSWWQLALAGAVLSVAARFFFTRKSAPVHRAGHRPKLIVCGAGFIAMELVPKLAALEQFDITVCDPKEFFGANYILCVCVHVCTCV
jgi:hypothetical protein